MKLQNNFTTPEQSKQLLEIGLPADSADCYYLHYGNNEAVNPDEPDILNFKSDSIETSCELPCWSVGRLMEIFHLIIPPRARFLFWMNISRGTIKDYAGLFVLAFQDMKDGGFLDFSKLEE